MTTPEKEVQPPPKPVDMRAVLRGESPLDTDTEERIKAVVNASFKCGEWNGDAHADESYARMMERSEDAQIELRKQIVRLMLEYGRVGDEMLNHLTEPEDDAELLRRYALYIEGVCTDNAEDKGFAPLRETKLAQANRLRELADAMDGKRLRITEEPSE
jgi:hypothetical protein